MASRVKFYVEINELIISARVKGVNASTLIAVALERGSKIFRTSEFKLNQDLDGSWRAFPNTSLSVETNLIKNDIGFKLKKGKLTVGYYKKDILGRDSFKVIGEATVLINEVAGKVGGGKEWSSIVLPLSTDGASMRVTMTVELVGNALDTVSAEQRPPLPVPAPPSVRPVASVLDTHTQCSRTQSASLLWLRSPLRKLQINQVLELKEAQLVREEKSRYMEESDRTIADLKRQLMSSQSHCVEVNDQLEGMREESRITLEAQRAFSMNSEAMLLEEILELSGRCARFQEENEKGHVMVSALEARIQNFVDRVSAAESKAEHAVCVSRDALLKQEQKDKEIQELREHLKSTEHEAEELKSKSEEYKRDMTVFKKERDAEIADLRAQFAEMEVDLRSSARKELESVQLSLRSLQAEYTGQQLDWMNAVSLADERLATCERLEQEKDDMLRKVDEYAGQSLNVKAVLARHLDELKGLVSLLLPREVIEEDVNNQTVHVMELSEELVSMVDTVKQHILSNKTFHDELSIAKSKLLEKDVEYDDLQGECNEFEKKISHLKIATACHEEELEKTKAQLITKRAEHDELLSLHNETRRRLELLEKQHMNVKTELERQRERKRGLEDRLTEREMSYQAALVEKDCLQAQLSEARQTRQQVESFASLKAKELVEVRRRLQEKEEEYTRLQAVFVKLEARCNDELKIQESHQEPITAKEEKKQDSNFGSSPKTNHRVAKAPQVISPVKSDWETMSDCDLDSTPKANPRLIKAPQNISPVNADWETMSDCDFVSTKVDPRVVKAPKVISLSKTMSDRNIVSTSIVNSRARTLSSVVYTGVIYGKNE